MWCKQVFVMFAPFETLTGLDSRVNAHGMTSQQYSYN